MAFPEILPDEVFIEIGECLVNLGSLSSHGLNNLLLRTIMDIFLRTPLHYPVRSGREGCVCTLPIAQCPLGVRDFGGKFALHSATEHGHKHIVGILLAWGAEGDMLDYKNRNPL